MVVVFALCLFLTVLEKSSLAASLFLLIAATTIVSVDAASSLAGVRGHVALIAVVDHFGESWVLLMHAKQCLS